MSQSQLVGVHDIVAIEGDGDEIFASLRLGDNQHRREIRLRVHIRDRNDVPEWRKFLVNTIAREGNSGQSFVFDGFDMNSTPWVAVQGHFYTDRRTGTVLPKEKCVRCQSWLRNNYDQFCSQCGSANEQGGVK